jgi:2-keto-4-pentenoate hydratase/2-oxohepta-3-ene-1,7-dioic acid hydratase in catechol pathway
MFALKSLLLANGPTGVIEVEGRCYPLSAARAVGLDEIRQTVFEQFEDWGRSESLLAEFAQRLRKCPELAVDGSVQTLAPVLYPHKVLCAGANYYDHLREMGVPAEKQAQRLFFFFKPPRQAIVGPGDTVRMPIDCQRFDWEVELAMVIGRRARAVNVEHALEYIAGYTVAIDLSARDLTRAPDQFYKTDWVAGKAHDTCCPMGPRFVPATFIDAPHDLRMQLWVNGELKQDARTSGMVFDMREQLAKLSRIMTLEPGDVVLTGTPAGVGAPKGTFLKVGDCIKADIESVGSLEVRIGSPA